MQKRLLDVPQVSKFLGISPHYVYKLVSMRQIPFVKLGRKLLFDVEKLETFIQENSVEVQDFDEKVKGLIR